MFAKGTGQWFGVLMVIRPDPSKLSLIQVAPPMARVLSPRLAQLDGRRAIADNVPYDLVKHFFNADDDDHCFVEAEYKDGHLEFYGRPLLRPDLKDWVQSSLDASGEVNLVH